MTQLGEPHFCWVKFIFNIYPFWKFDPSSSNNLKVSNFEDSIEGDPSNLAPLISVEHWSSLISSIALTLNTVRSVVLTQIAAEEKEKKVRKKTQNKKRAPPNLICIKHS